MFKNAFVSVSDKTNLIEFIKPLADKGMRVVATGGTAKFLKDGGVPVVDIVEQTSFKEVFSGRVKSLHPNIFMPVLARDWVKEDQKTLKEEGLEAFDLVVCNLYPFEQKMDIKEDQQLSEWIDVGGPSLLRASAKNFFTVTTLCFPDDYKKVQKGSSLEQRKQLAVKTFEYLSHYDSVIATRLGKDIKQEDSPKSPSAKINFFKSLRYGENPHQKADWHKKIKEQGLHQAEVLQGKELSFNNLLDFSNAVESLREFHKPCCVAVKHNNPCGVACGKDIFSSVSEALQADPVSVFGGVLAINGLVDEKTAQKITELFLEGVVAVDFSKEALEVLKSKKNLRVLKWKDMMSFPMSKIKSKEILGGVLFQDRDQTAQKWNNAWTVIGTKSVPEDVKEDLLFAWKVCSHLSSNAIAIVKDQQTLGLGMGQVNRVDAVSSAIERAKKFHSKKTKNMILASDAFFPFADSIEIAFKAGVQWIIQPGGSIKDEEVIETVKKLGLNMVLTGQRHFKH